MGQVIEKVYTVSPDSSSDLSHNLFGSIQEAIDAADSETTIILGPGNHVGDNSAPISMKSGLKFIGLPGSYIASPLIGEVNDITFDNVVFKNQNNLSFDFANIKPLLFRNCEFQINIKGSKTSSGNPNVRFGFHIINSSAILQNPTFNINVENLDIFAVIAADNNCSHLSLQSPTIYVKYKNVHKIETYFFHGTTQSINIPHFESFSGSINYYGDTHNIYDGHCCVKEDDKYKCTKRHCGRCNINGATSRNKVSNKCKLTHHCCDEKCKYNKEGQSALDSSSTKYFTNIRLFRGFNGVNTSIMSTKIYFIGGRGFFNIAGGDSIICINGLTAFATIGEDWELGDFNELLLSSFISNLKDADEIKECHYVNKIFNGGSDSESYTNNEGKPLSPSFQSWPPIQSYYSRNSISAGELPFRNNTQPKRTNNKDISENHCKLKHTITLDDDST